MGNYRNYKKVTRGVTAAAAAGLSGDVVHVRLV